MVPLRAIFGTNFYSSPGGISTRFRLWTQGDLAEKSGVSLATIKRLKAMTGDLVGNTTTLRSLERALRDGGVLFLESGSTADGGIGVRLASEVPASLPAADEKADRPA